MFLPPQSFILLLLVPIVVSIVLIRLVDSKDAPPQARVPATYWGSYAGVASALPVGTIALRISNYRLNIVQYGASTCGDMASISNTRRSYSPWL